MASAAAAVRAGAARAECPGTTRAQPRGGTARAELTQRPEPGPARCLTDTARRFKRG